MKANHSKLREQTETSKAEHINEGWMVITYPFTCFKICATCTGRVMHRSTTHLGWPENLHGTLRLRCASGDFLCRNFNRPLILYHPRDILGPIPAYIYICKPALTVDMWWYRWDTETCWLVSKYEWNTNIYMTYELYIRIAARLHKATRKNYKKTCLLTRMYKHKGSKNYFNNKRLCRGPDTRVDQWLPLYTLQRKTWWIRHHGDYGWRNSTIWMMNDSKKHIVCPNLLRQLRN